jgi:hypothetical protein
MQVNKINNRTEYFTHNNHARPYKVVIENNTQVYIYKSSNNDENHDCLFSTINPEQILIGKSIKKKMTEFSGGYGDEFDGNSILLRINESTYIYIGEKIMLFNTTYPIISYHSPVGNNDVPYPYAIDSANNYYLIIEEVILKSTTELHKFLSENELPTSPGGSSHTVSSYEPYDYYYNASLITNDMGCNRKPLFDNNFNINKFYIGKELYTMIYKPFPSKEYDRLTSSLGDHLYIRDHNNKKHEVTKKEYIEIMEDFGIVIGASPMVNIVNINIP